MKTAFVVDWLVTYAGAERVLEQMLLEYPDADLFALVDFLESDSRHFLNGHQAQTSFIQNMPKAKQWYRHYLPFMPLAIEQIDVSAYDVIISSSHAVAKGVITGPDQLHVSYVHTPIRYAWDLQHQYLKESGLTKGFKSILARIILHYIRLWDYRTAAGVDIFIANSQYIARRIKKVYRRDAQVIYPPVDLEGFQCCPNKENYYLIASRMVPYKKIPLIIKAFAGMPDKRLVVIGDGPEMAKCKEMSASNIEILGYQSFSVLRDYMQRAKAFVFAAEEDFGITLVEAQACGTPVITFGKGGGLETVVPRGQAHPTGIFFYEQTVAALQASVAEFEQYQDEFLPESCRKNAERFSVERFRTELSDCVGLAWQQHIQYLHQID